MFLGWHKDTLYTLKIVSEKIHNMKCSKILKLMLSWKIHNMKWGKVLRLGKQRKEIYEEESFVS